MAITGRLMILMLSVALGISGSSVAQGSKKTATVLVVPSRYTMVELGMNMLKLRPVTLIAYDMSGGSRTPSVSVWNRQAADWVVYSMADFTDGSLFSGASARVIVIGDSENSAGRMGAAAGWARSVKLIPSLDIVTVVNGIDEVLDFTADEWRFIAKKHRLKLKDSNKNRRRWGRYGPPPWSPDSSEEDEQSSRPVLPPGTDVQPESGDTISPMAVAVPPDTDIEGSAQPAPVEEKGGPSVVSAPPAVPVEEPVIEEPAEQQAADK